MMGFPRLLFKPFKFRELLDPPLKNATQLSNRQTWAVRQSCRWSLLHTSFKGMPVPSSASKSRQNTRQGDYVT